MMCSAEEFIDTPANNWTESLSPESDAVLLECDDPTGGPVDDESVEANDEAKVISPKEVREAADAVLQFSEENKL
jgi:hypothetical protein